MRIPSIALLAVALAVTAAWGQQGRAQRAYPAELPGAEVEVYKTIGDAKLNMYVFTPQGHRATDSAPAIMFFFGGGWRGGTPMQFYRHCKYLASRGMVAMAADYRVASRHGTKAVACVADGKSAVRWIRANARRLGVDPNRIAVGGGSAGGHVAACTGTVAGLDEAGEETTVSSTPNALVLFNPVLVLAPIDAELPFDEQRMRALQQRLGVEATKLSPCHNVRRGAPPTIVFHGTGDTTVPFRTAELFKEAMTKAGNQCELVGFEGKPHGFFNYGRGDNVDFVKTVQKMDEFLVRRGFLVGKPTIERWLEGE